MATAARYSEHRGSRLHEKHGDFIHFEIEPPAIKFYIVLYVSIYILVFIANCVWLYRFFPRFVGGGNQRNINIDFFLYLLYYDSFKQMLCIYKVK